ncbi:MAG: hypothetical protein HYS13_11980 [Planctomycetia bacterium]|nr:hypothetical protein [Planctomycetia bacterium]
MEASSAALELEPLAPADGPDNRRVVIDLFHETIERIQAGKSVDARFTFDDLVAFRDLATPLQRHSRELWINGEKLTAKYVAQLELILGSAIPSKGQLSGRLERLNVHDRYEFVLFPAAGPRVVCIFDEAMFEEVRNAIKRMVTVSGTLYFQPDRPLPDRVRVDKMEIHPPDDELPKLRDLRATSPNCTGKLTAVDFVRALRDE